MNLINLILALFGLKVEKTTDQVLSGFNKIIAELDTVEKQQDDKHTKAEAELAAAGAKRDAAYAERHKAADKKAKIKDVFG